LQPVFRKRLKLILEMSRICQITGKTAMVGNNVSHSKRRTKRTFDVNLFDKRLFLQEENRWVNLRVSAAGIRTINKVGLKKALEEAKIKGYIKSI
jgi:large subunit ribosomal protein L28